MIKKCKSPYFFAGLAIGSILLGHSFSSTYSQRKNDLKESRRLYANAIAKTHFALAENLNELANDAGIIKNLQWKLQHSIQRGINARIQPGIIDHIELTLANCKSIHVGSLAASRLIPCKKLKLGFHWLDHEAPTLALTRTIKNQSLGTIFLTGYVNLEKNWFELYPDLAQSIKRNELKIGKESNFRGTWLIKEGLLEDGTAIASLGSQRSFDRLIGGRPFTNREFNNPFFDIGLLALILILGYIWWHESTTGKNRRRELTEFTNWCRTLSNSDPEEEGPCLKIAQKNISKAIQYKMESIRVNQRKKDFLEKQLKEQQLENQNLKHRLSELVEWDSLAHQMELSTEMFLQKMNSLDSHCEDISDILDETIANECQSLFSILNFWKDGIEERGSRKFIRGLAETPGEEENNTMLDDQISQMINISEKIRDGAISSSVHSSQISDIANATGQIAAHWQGLAAIHNNATPCESLSLALADVDKLLEFSEKKQIVPNFDYQISTDLERKIPDVPQEVWATAVYHIACSLTNSSGQPVVCRMRKEVGRYYLILTAVDDTKHQQQNKRSSFHLDIARALLAQYPVKISALPVRTGTFPIAISWDESHIFNAHQKLPQATTKILGLPDNTTKIETNI